MRWSNNIKEMCVCLFVAWADLSACFISWEINQTNSTTSGLAKRIKNIMKEVLLKSSSMFLNN